MTDRVELTYDGGWALLHAIDTKLGVICFLLVLILITLLLGFFAAIQQGNQHAPTNTLQPAPAVSPVRSHDVEAPPDQNN